MNRSLVFPFLLFITLFFAGAAFAQPTPPARPSSPIVAAQPTATPQASPTPSSAPGGNLTLSIGGLGSTGNTQQQVSTGLQILALLTILSLAPAILTMVTSFVRIVIVLGFVRRAMGTPEVPPNQVLLGLAIFLTFFVMAPTFTKVNDVALQPYFAGKIGPAQAAAAGIAPIREYLFQHCRKPDLALFVKLSKIDRPRSKDDVPTHVLIPAYLTSELKTAFIIGFLIYIPFLIIDMVVSSILLSMGMMMLPPVIISLPFKILLFVLVDGWSLVIGSLMRSF